MIQLKLFVNYLILLGASIFLFSCNQEATQDAKFKIINVKYLEKVKLSDLIKQDYSYLPLQSDTNDLIGDASRIIINDSLIYILDSNISKRIFCFNTSGQLRYSFGALGDGPGEYNNPSDLAITKDELLVHDGDNFTMLTYDLAGNFRQEEMIGLWLEEFIPFMDNQFLVYSPTNYSPDGLEGEPYVLRIMTADFQQTVKGFFPYEEVLDDASFSGLLTSYQDNYSYARPIYGDIYTIDNKSHLLPRYKIDFGKHSWPITMEEIKNNQDSMEELFFKGGIMTIVHRLLETKNYFVFQTFMINKDEKRNKLDYTKDRWWCIYKKGGDKCFAIHKIINDIDGGVFSFPIATSGNLFVSRILAESLIGSINDKNKIHREGGNFKNLQTMVDSLTIFSNPVLMTFKLKEDITF